MVDRNALSGHGQADGCRASGRREHPGAARLPRREEQCRQTHRFRLGHRAQHPTRLLGHVFEISRGEQVRRRALCDGAYPCRPAVQQGGGGERCRKSIKIVSDATKVPAPLIEAAAPRWTWFIERRNAEHRLLHGAGQVLERSMKMVSGTVNERAAVRPIAGVEADARLARAIRSPDRRECMPAVAIEFEDIGLTFAPASAHLRSALEAVSCGFEPGKVTAIIGPSGCGKSTLLQIARGFLEPTRGTIALRRACERQSHGAPGDVDGVAGLQPVSLADGHRECRLRSRSGWRRKSERDARARRRLPRSISPVLKTDIRASCRVACASGSGLPARW